MTERQRFCVQFAGSQPHCSKKTRLLYSDSTTDEIREIWKLIYDSTDVPHEIEIIAGNQTSYLLNDGDDFQVFIAMAEDQYRLIPAKPLSVVICVPGEYRPSPPFCTPSPDHVVTPATIAYEGKLNGYYKKIEKASDLLEPPSFKQESNNYNPNQQSYEFGSREASPRAFRPRSPDVPSHRYNGNGGKHTDGLSPPQDLSCPRSNHDSSGFKAIDFSRGTTSTSTSTTVQPKPIYPSAVNGKSHLGMDSLSNLGIGLLPTTSAQAPVVTSGCSIANSLQQQRFLQNSPSASYILQSFLRSNFERAAALQLAGNGNGVSAGNGNESKHTSILANTLNDFRALQEQNFSMNCNEVKKRKRKSYPKVTNMQQNGAVGRVIDTSKRMRSSPTQSNIEYHYERAVEYHTMTEEEQKCHNSAHRSHWKHLLFVSQASPNFLTTFRNAKYDEWSSEARDIFAISMPDKYKWSFLTLSKQGDVLCRRIKQRVQDLKNMSMQNRPEWCPTDEVLEIAQHRAEERLAQLERISYSRAHSVAQDENNKALQACLPKHQNNHPYNLPALASALSSAFPFPPPLKKCSPEVTKPVDSPVVFPAIKHENLGPEETC